MSPTISMKHKKLTDNSNTSKSNKYKRVFSPQNFELKNRYMRLDAGKEFIHLPNFDRGKRKISKMGGVHVMMFSKNKS